MGSTNSAEERTLSISQGIEAGEEYEVRVAAKNKVSDDDNDDDDDFFDTSTAAFFQAGESESAKSSNSFVAKARFVRPKIDRDALGGQKELFAGITLIVSVMFWFSGFK